MSPGNNVTPQAQLRTQHILADLIQLMNNVPQEEASGLRRLLGGRGASALEGRNKGERKPRHRGHGGGLARQWPQSRTAARPRPSG